MTYAETSALLVALVAALFTALQWASARRSAESSDRSALASERSAAAAEESASSTQALTQLGHRPWMTLEPPECSELQSGDYTSYIITVRGLLRNSGLTPALDVRVITQFGQWALPVNAWPLEEPAASSMSVGPKVTLNVLPHPLPVRNEHMAELNEGRRALLFCGECSYRDVFGETHRTRWCLQYHVGRRTFVAFNSEFNVIT